MNHGSVGCITDEGHLLLSNNVVNEFCLQEGSKMYGVYYPFPKTSANADYDNATVRNDFMLSPIPDHLWAVSARVYVHLKHTEDAVRRLMSFLAAKHISIIYAKCTRSGYRYITWSLNIAFEKLVKEKLKYVDKQNYFQETHLALQNIKKEIRSFVMPGYEEAIQRSGHPKLALELREVLFAPDYLRPIWGGDNSRLAFFAQCIKSPDHAEWIKDKWPIRPFELSLSTKGDENVFKSPEFNKILDYISVNENISVKPSVVYSELNTDTLNTRISIIPEHDRKRFFALGLTYSVNDYGRCVGVIKKVVEEFPSTYKLWNFYNHIQVSDDEKDGGRLNFIVEAMPQNREHDHRNSRDYISEAESVLSTLINKYKGQSVSFDEPKVHPLLTPSATSIVLDKNNKRRKKIDFIYDIFISYSHLDANFVHKKLIPLFEQHGIKCAVDKDFLEFGKRIDTEILKKIQSSREICSVLTSNSIKSEWVTKERTAAWVLDKDLIVLVYQKEFKVPDWCSDVLYVRAYDPNQLIEYIKLLIKKKGESEGDDFSKHFSSMIT